MSHPEPAVLDIPIGTSASVISVRPVVLPAPGRGEDLQVRFVVLQPTHLDSRTLGLAPGDPRVAAGVLLAVAGTGEDDLTPFAAESFSFMDPSFAEMTPPAIVIESR
jgi:hypothetical protein